MAKKKANTHSIKDVEKFLKPKTFLPIYFLIGEDEYAINSATEQIKEAVQPLILSDFDKEIIDIKKNQDFNEIVNIANAYPFGGGKKLLILKNLEKAKSENLKNYILNPSNHTFLIITYLGTLKDYNSEPFKSLEDKQYLFQTPKVYYNEFINWIKERANSYLLSISNDGAVLLLELVGEDKSLLDIQLNKFFNYLGPNTEISEKIIIEQTAITKEFNIFNLLDEIGQGNRAKAIEIVFNLLDNKFEIYNIIGQLSKYVATIAQIYDIIKNENTQPVNLMRESSYYLQKCSTARIFMSEKRLQQSVQALLKADIAIKTSQYDHKTILTILINEMLA
ncbi:MAG: DNA polymerase III subunit delta [Ignavibacteriales bacterium]|nr:DNA polymerase III subunit delta [Ignavibacteriales bacterium]